MLLVSIASINGQALADTVSYENIKIAPGDIVPDFSAQDENLKFRKLSELRGKKNLILVFFRGYWWPHCRRQLANLSNFKFPKDVEIWAISVESPKSSLAYKNSSRKKGEVIPFRLLWDKDSKITKKFGIIDPRYIGSGKEGIPYASTYVINKEGVTTFAKVLLNYRLRPSISQILSAIDQ